ncbi:DUF6048 family protein [Lacinutrix salivirga]
MKQLHIITYSTSLLFALCFCFGLQAQDTNEVVKDSINIEQKYGLRLGLDLSKLVRSFIEEDYKAFEINGDYRVTENWYIAGELGTEEKIVDNEYIKTTTKGSYLKAGLDYNMYTNWLDMENMIYSGFRVGTSSFSQTLNNYSVYSQNQYWQPQFTANNNEEFKGLTAIWIELQLGIKAEVLNNLFIGANVQLKGMISQDQPAGFENLYVPGFNRTYDSGRFGVGYAYNISYLIPIFKKKK